MLRHNRYYVGRFFRPYNELYFIVMVASRRRCPTLRLNVIKEMIQFLKSFDHCGRQLSIAYFTASKTNSGFRESYKDLKSNVKQLIFFFSSRLSS